MFKQKISPQAGIFFISYTREIYLIEKYQQCVLKIMFPWQETFADAEDGGETGTTICSIHHPTHDFYWIENDLLMISKIIKSIGNHQNYLSQFAAPLPPKTTTIKPNI